MLARQVVHQMAHNRLLVDRFTELQRARRRLPSIWEQPLLMALIVALVWGLSIAGGGLIARPVYIMAACGTCVYYTGRRLPWHYLTMTFWFWTITPFVRRVIDYHAGFDPVNILLATPNLVCMFMLKDILTSRELLRMKETIVGLFLLVPVLYGLSVSFVQGDILPGLSSLADWLPPLLYYFYIIAHWREIGEGDLPFSQLAAANMLVMVVYALAQFVSPQPWDVEWVRQSGMVVIGSPVAFEMRLFGTLNSPGHLAPWLATSLLLFLHFRTRFSVFLIPAAVLVILLTYVRSALGQLILGLLLAALLGRAGIFKVLATSAIVGSMLLVILPAIDPAISDKVTDRFFGSVGDLGNDGSAMARQEIYARGPALMNEYPFGVGIGAVGRGAALTQKLPIIFDAGPVEIFVTFGWVGGAVYLVGFVLVTLQALQAARKSRSPAALAMAVAATSGTSLLLFTDIAGFAAATIWPFAGYAVAIGIATRQQRALLPSH